MVKVEMRDIMSRYCSDVLALCTLGLQLDSCAQPHNELYTAGQNITDFQGTRAAAIFGYLFSTRLMKVR